MTALTDLELQSRATELGLSYVGTRSTLLEMIKDKESLQVKETSIKKRKQRRRKKKTRIIKDQTEEDAMETDEMVEIEYVPEMIALAPEFSEFSKILNKFQEPTETIAETAVEKLPVDETPDLEDLEDSQDEKPLSKKKMKKLNRPSVAALKKVAFMPEVVDVSISKI